MKNQGLRLSILDQSPVQDGCAGPEALQRTIELAQAAERWGYHRFWVAEHHNSDSYMGSSPEVLISHLLAKTDRIRVGSGGVMLQHYSPYKVAENFNVLASLGPGRVDLGIGRGPGGLPRSTRALQEELAAEKKPFRNKLVELEQWLGRSKELDDAPPRVSAKPLPRNRPMCSCWGLRPPARKWRLSWGCPTFTPCSSTTTKRLWGKRCRFTGTIATPSGAPGPSYAGIAGDRRRD